MCTMLAGGTRHAPPQLAVRETLPARTTTAAVQGHRVWGLEKVYKQTPDRPQPQTEWSQLASCQAPGRRQVLGRADGWAQFGDPCTLNPFCVLAPPYPRPLGERCVGSVLCGLRHGVPDHALVRQVLDEGPGQGQIEAQTVRLPPT